MGPTVYEITPEFVAEFNRMRDALDQMTREGHHGGLDFTSHFGFVFLQVNGAAATPGTGRYLATPIAGGNDDMAVSLTIDSVGFVDDNAQQVELWNIAEITPNASQPLGENMVIIAWQAGWSNISHKPVYHTCLAYIGDGQYQYMVYQMVAQNVTGWDYTRLGPLMNSNS